MIDIYTKEENINGHTVVKTLTDINNLKPNLENPREISEEKLEDLKNFLSKYPSIKPILVDIRPDHEGEVIGGNMRLRAYKELGINEVWVELRDPMTNAQAFELATIDNMEFGHYVEAKLMEALKQYKDEIDFSKLGVHLGEIPTFEQLMKKFNKEVVEDEAPEVSQEPAKSELGKVYQLGKWVYCTKCNKKHNLL